MNWAAIALGLIQLVASLLEWTKSRNAIAQAQEQELARQALRLLELTEQGKKIRAAISSLDDSSAEALWLEMINAK